jgi:TRAP-type C4-dicarboxylate transport system permease small subunit
MGIVYFIIPFGTLLMAVITLLRIVKMMREFFGLGRQPRGGSKI